MPAGKFEKVVYATNANISDAKIDFAGSKKNIVDGKNNQAFGIFTVYSR